MLLGLIPVEDQAAAILLIDKIKSQCTGVSLSDRELATILFSLRLFQSELERAGGGEIIDPNGFFDEADPLNPDEIDVLCETLNCGGAE